MSASSQRWRVRLGSEVEVRAAEVEVRHPLIPTLIVRREPGDTVVISPLASDGQWLELRR